MAAIYWLKFKYYYLLITFYQFILQGNIYVDVSMAVVPIAWTVKKAVNSSGLG